MGRKADPSIQFYRMMSDHTLNKKVKLLFGEFNADGYWIWQCLLGYAYRTKGYFFDTKDKDELELFSTDICKKSVSQVKEVIAGCIRRSLFDKRVADMFGILTSEMMQEVYLYATADRRFKGTEFSMVKEYILLNTVDNERNISIVPLNYKIVPPTYPLDQQNYSQKKRKETKQEESLGLSPENLKSFEKFNAWANANAPNVLKMTDPLDATQLVKLKVDFTTAQIQELILAMHNRKNLIKDNISTYLTFLNWAKRRQWCKTDANEIDEKSKKAIFG